MRMPGFDVVGDGGLFTTAEDMAKWNPTTLDSKLHAAGLSALMVSPGSLVTGDKLNYAMGLYLHTYRGLQTVRHGGTYGGYGAEFSVVPSANMTIAILCNTRAVEPYVLRNRIIDVYLSDRLVAPLPAAAAASSTKQSEPPKSESPLEVGDLPGSYFSDELDVRWTVLLGATDGIALQRRDLPPMALASRDTTRTHFTVTGTPAEVRFVRDASGRVAGFIPDAGDISDIRFVKLK